VPGVAELQNSVGALTVSATLARGGQPGDQCHLVSLRHRGAAGRARALSTERQGGRPAARPIRVWGRFVWGAWQPGRTDGPQKVQTNGNVCFRHYDA
jgi:hypothetical protein